MISGIFVKVLSITLILAVGIVLILGIGTLFKGGETSKKYSNKLMQLRVLLQFVAIIVLVCFGNNNNAFHHASYPALSSRQIPHISYS